MKAVLHALEIFDEESLDWGNIKSIFKARDIINIMQIKDYNIMPKYVYEILSSYVPKKGFNVLAAS